MKIIDYISGILLVVLFSLLIAACIISVAAGEEGRVVKNDAFKANAAYHAAKGDMGKALIYNNISNIETQMYDVVVEYDGVQYTIETNTKYESGAKIRFSIPEE